jgi:hypothetical protein
MRSATWIVVRRAADAARIEDHRAAGQLTEVLLVTVPTQNYAA